MTDSRTKADSVPNAQELNDLSSSDLVAVYRLLEDGLPTLEDACPDPCKARDAIASLMAKVVRQLTDADCVFVRIVNSDGSLELVGKPDWRPGIRVGTPPRVKRAGEGISAWAIQNCKSEPLVVQDIGSHNIPIGLREAHERSIKQEKLSADEHEFVDFIRAEACVSLLHRGHAVGIVVAVRGTAYSEYEAMQVTRRLRAFKLILRSYYLVGWVLHDYHTTTRRIRNLSRLPPLLTASPNHEVFLRQILAILTCHCGLGWHRAFLFTFDDNYPSDARCVMAIGGLGDERWSEQHERLSHIVSLEEFLNLCRSDAFAIDDSLYQLVREGTWVIPQVAFERNPGLSDFFSAKEYMEPSEIREEHVWFLSPGDDWLKSVSPIGIFDGLAAGCEHVVVPLNSLVQSPSGFAVCCHGFVLLDNPYVCRGQTPNQLPLTLLYCKQVSADLLTSGLLTSKKRLTIEEKSCTYARDSTFAQCSELREPDQSRVGPEEERMLPEDEHRSAVSADCNVTSANDSSDKRSSVSTGRDWSSFFAGIGSVLNICPSPSRLEISRRRFSLSKTMQIAWCRVVDDMNWAEDAAREQARTDAKARSTKRSR